MGGTAGSTAPQGGPSGSGPTHQGGLGSVGDLSGMGGVGDLGGMGGATGGVGMGDLAGGAGASGTDPVAFNVDVRLTRRVNQFGDISVVLELLPWRAGCGGCDEGFPRPDECRSLSVDAFDVFGDGYCLGCAPEPGRCIESFALERGAEIVVAASYDPNREDYPPYGAFERQVPDVFGADDTDLVIRGCGEEVRIPLLTSEAPRPMLSAVLYGPSNTYVTARWSTDRDAHSASMTINDAYLGGICVVSDANEATLPIESTESCLSVRVAAYALPIETVTTYGRIQTLIGHEIQAPSNPELFDCSDE